MQLASACAKGDLFKVAQLLNDGDEVDAAFVGVYPLQTAIEEGHVDVVAMLLHKGADMSLVRGKSTVKRAEAKHPLIKRLLDDEAFRAEYQPGLVERVAAAEIVARENAAAVQRKLMLLLVFLLTAIMVTFLALSVFVRLDPDAAAKALPKKLIEHIESALSVALSLSLNSTAQSEVRGGQEL
eukprot:TRINITY_DN94038_c0_g1_i1.p1 TRINITY_DN94038_c0_g1~~TRINITY_DN94038_c0_g1_i1.p1  ORF type:complete len:183 (+),score=41.73 TRINITY_DN94038_c0_g1_i1:222-770(+)